ncbi:hypothetical protein PSTEL_23990 [Paenibacillus stellifer]|uniref:Uncharacterized protein n=1 Tax=Paenibacillus stellifer TaxID=169760 RepID=A0A089LVY6_9BACL|nr:hypothetical protein PSTEL_23990 [Paenibacillus stellifer]
MHQWNMARLFLRLMTAFVFEGFLNRQGAAGWERRRHVPAPTRRRDLPDICIGVRQSCSNRGNPLVQWKELPKGLLFLWEIHNRFLYFGYGGSPKSNRSRLPGYASLLGE